MVRKEKLKELIEKELNRKILEEVAKVTKARWYRDIRYAKFLVIYFVIFALGIASFVFTFKYTGLFTLTGENLTQNMSYTDVLNLEINQSQEYNWTLGNFCNLENCTLKSISMSGHVIANQSGNVSIYLENLGKQYIIFNKSFELNKTIISQNITAEQNITVVNETTNETYVQTVNTTQEVNITIEQPEVFYFNDSCIEICNLADVFNKSYYNLRFDLTQNISLMLYSIRYSWVIEKEFEFKPEENITEKNITGNRTGEENKTENKTVVKPQIAIDFKGRESSKNIPENWFVKSELGIEDSDDGPWEWIPLSEDRPDTLLIDLFKLNNLEEWYVTPHLKIYSKVVRNIRDDFAISFYYKPEFSGECLQLGTEVLFDGVSIGTFMFNLNETGVTSYFSDFNSTYEAAGDWIKVDASSNFQVPDNASVMFYFASLCNEGKVYVKNFTYYKMEESK
jgi:hypothetical protein